MVRISKYDVRNYKPRNSSSLPKPELKNMEKSTGRHIIVKLPESNSKERVLGASRRKEKGRSPGDRRWTSIFKHNRKNCHPTNLPKKISFKNEGGWGVFP